MFIRFILNIFFVSYTISQNFISDSEEMKYFSYLEEQLQPILSKANLQSELFDVRCFWAKGFNVYDISNLQTDDM